MWSSGSGKNGVPRKALAPLVLTGLAGVLILVAGQMFVQKERNMVKRLPATPVRRASSAALSAGPQSNNMALVATSLDSTNLPVSPNLQRVAPRLWSLYGGRFLLQLDDVPMMGSSDASNVIVNLFDYNCTHCRLLHPMLATVQRRLSNELAIVCLPMPMDSHCNSFVPSKYPTFTNSCEYARLCLAVWRANRFVFAQFDDWLFSPEKPAPSMKSGPTPPNWWGLRSWRPRWPIPGFNTRSTACELHHRNWEATGSGPPCRSS